MDSPPAPHSTPHRDPPRALAPLRALVVVGAILWSLWVLVGHPPALSGALDSLHAAIDLEHRAPPLLLVRVDASRNTGAVRQDPDRILDRVAVRLADELLDARVPIAPPAAAVEGWLDTHGMYLLPVAAHPQLAQRLEREQMEASIAAIRARLSSPVHGVGGLNPRRDPLSLQPLIFGKRGAMSYVDTEVRATATGTGDLRSRKTDSLLIGLREDADEKRVREIAARVSESDPVYIDLVGVRAQDGLRREQLRELLPTLAILLLSSALGTIAFARRSANHALHSVAIAVLSVTCMLHLVPTLDPLTVPILCLLLSTCMAVLACPPLRFSVGAVGILATALLPMLTLPYAPWKSLAWIWPAVIMLALVLRWCARPAVEPPTPHDPSTDTAPPPTSPTPFAARARAVAICITVFMGASLTLRDFDPEPSSNFNFGSAYAHELEEAVARDFFAARNIIQFESEGTSVTEILDRSPLSLEPLKALLGEVANRVDSPGSFVLPGELLESRRRSLRTLNIDEKIGDLREILKDQGFRDEAFNEFLNGATELRRFPDAKAALESGLGEWIKRFIREEESRVVLTHELELRRVDPEFLPVITEVGTPRGPAISRMIELRDFEQALLTLLLIQLWLVTFLVWVSARQLSHAIAAGVSVAGTLASVLMLIEVARLSLGVTSFPVLLVCGATAGATAHLRHSRNEARWKSWCCVWLATAGLALLASGQSGWIEQGLILTFGLVVAVGFGRFIAPGLEDVLSRQPPPGAPSATDEDAPAAPDERSTSAKESPTDEREESSP